MKENYKTIVFKRTDSLEPFMIEATREIADHFKSKRPYFMQFCSVIRSSYSWDIRNWENQFKRHEVIFERLKGTKLVKIMKKAFNNCNSKADLNKLRGTMVESLLIAKNGGYNILSKNSKKTFGWGAKVVLHKGDQQSEVAYICPYNKSGVVDKNGCRRRSSIDFASWDGFHGQFYECKVLPDKIGCSEVEYMKTLKEELNQYQISHEVFFVSVYDKEAVEEILKGYDLKEPAYKAIGIKELGV
ncbi:hypothetical protein ABEW22_00240 [Bacillus velezensis]|uniref:hypothetical protein n=1 Tax=Bacillus TaxID=1386 RepID=UPI0025C96F27|nr:hypothetical protein [Bacillus velezensis]MDN4139884.1 hypothetical protein [Bacillus velezensis]MEC1135113.1 hypothetical protein [Bacillus velezensis]